MVQGESRWGGPAAGTGERTYRSVSGVWSDVEQWLINRLTFLLLWCPCPPVNVTAHCHTCMHAYRHPETGCHSSCRSSGLTFVLLRSCENADAVLGSVPYAVLKVVMKDKQARMGPPSQITCRISEVCTPYQVELRGLEEDRCVSLLQSSCVM